MKYFDFSTARQSDCVVVLGGGPTTGSKLQDAYKYAQKNDALIISSNYDHTIPLDYIAFATEGKFQECADQNPKCKNLIVRDKITPWTKRYKGYEFSKYCDQSSSKGAYSLKSISMTKKGRFPIYNIGNAGFSTLVLSSLCKPKKILIVGFDGLLESGDKKLTWKNKVKAYIPKKGKLKSKYFGRVVVPFILNQGIHVEAYECDTLWGWRGNIDISLIK